MLTSILGIALLLMVLVIILCIFMPEIFRMFGVDLQEQLKVLEKETKSAKKQCMYCRMDWRTGATYCFNCGKKGDCESLFSDDLQLAEIDDFFLKHD